MTESLRPLILLTNDDGIEAEGIRALAEALYDLGELWIVAPRHEQSAKSHAITIHDPIRARKQAYQVAGQAVEAYAVTGTPADCVKMAVHSLCPRKPDLVVSGINHGPNAAINTLYSGTVGAALEATINGCKSFAISLHDFGNLNFVSSSWAARQVAAQILTRGLPDGTLLNVNVPPIAIEAIKGFATTRQARSRWIEEFEERVDTNKHPYYWLGGYFVNLDDGDDTDLAAIENGFVSVTPMKLDWTDHAFTDKLRTWEW